MDTRSRSPSTKSLTNLENINYLDPQKTNHSERPMNQLLNTMSSRNVMTKPKYGGICMNLTQRIKNSSKCLIFISIIVFLTYISVYFLEITPDTVPMMNKDRTTDYKVKVLPATLSDEELNKLPKETFSYLAMIDAGSSGCRAHIYRYGKLGNSEGPLYILPQHNSKKIKPGLSSFANNPNDAGKSLTGLIEFMKEQVPLSDWEVTPIWLKATAGLRMLPTATSDNILESVRSFLNNKENSPFLFRSSWARVIPGNEEGGFGWIAFNYLKRVIGPKRHQSLKPHHPYAVIEMGGASAQVSQLAPSVEEANKIPSDYRFSFNIEGEEFHLYTHSYLGYGAEQAKEQYLRILQKNNKDIQSTITTATAAASTSSASSSALTSRDPCKHDGFTSSRKSRRQLLHDRLQHHRRLQDGNSTISTPPSTPVKSEREVTAPTTTTSSPTGTSTSTTSSTTTSTTSSTSGSTNSDSIKPSGPTCSRNVAALFNSAISTDKCSLSGPYSFGCVHQPDFIAKSPNILAFENFFYMASAIGVKSIHAGKEKENKSNDEKFPLETTPRLIKEASDKFCSLHWNEVEKSYPIDSQPKDVNQKTCFISAFAYSFLVDGLKIPDDKTITIQREVGTSEIEWALGAAYKETADLLKRTHLRPT